MTMDAHALQERLLAALAPGRDRADAALLREADRWTGPARLLEAMRYAVLGDGKRVRPALAFAVAEAKGGLAALPRAEAAACALEWIHAYSLVHDDLPALDNDDYRRGRLSVHKAFDEALAILVGDALQAEAFRVAAADDGCGRSSDVRLAQTISIAKAAGAFGMVGGQVIDMSGTMETADDMRHMHALKTGALFVSACEIGAHAAELPASDVAAFAQYGAHVGLAFQLSDDMLDLDEVEDSAHEADVNLAHVLGVDAALALVEQDCAAADALLDAQAVPAESALRLMTAWIAARARSVKG